MAGRGIGIGLGRGWVTTREDGPFGFKQRQLNRDAISETDTEETRSRASFTSILTTEFGSSDDALTTSGDNYSFISDLTSLAGVSGREDDFSDVSATTVAMESDRESHSDSVYFTTDEGSDDEEMEEGDSDSDGGESFPDPDFLLPAEVKIPTLGDKITESYEATCLVGEVRSPSEFYLTLARHCPEELDNFVAFMSDAYRAWTKHPRRHVWMLAGKEHFLQPGATVACFNPSSNAREANEIVRARIIRDASKDHKKRYDVFLIDLAQHHREVPSFEMFFLYDQFVKIPAWGIKCRFHLDPSYDHYHEGAEKWPKGTNRFMMDALKGKRMKVRFVRRIVQGNEEPIWEVSILELDPAHPHIKEGRLVEKQIISRTMGSYETAKGKK